MAKVILATWIGLANNGGRVSKYGPWRVAVMVDSKRKSKHMTAAICVSEYSEFGFCFYRDLMIGLMDGREWIRGHLGLDWGHEDGGMVWIGHGGFCCKMYIGSYFNTICSAPNVYALTTLNCHFICTLILFVSALYKQFL